MNNKNKTSKIIGIIAMLSCLAGSPVFAVSDTQAVWDHHIEAWKARSVDEIASDYSDTSVLVVNNQMFKGRDQIAHVFSQLFRIFDKGTNRIDTPLVFDRFVYITWRFIPAGGQDFFGTDTFVIEDGKIILQTIASPLYDAYPVSPPRLRTPTIGIIDYKNAWFLCSYEGAVPKMQFGRYEGHEDRKGSDRNCEVVVRSLGSIDNILIDARFSNGEYSNVSLICHTNQDYDERFYRGSIGGNLVTLYPIGLDEVQPRLVRFYDIKSRKEKSCWF